LDDCFTRAGILPGNEDTIRRLLGECFQEVERGVPLQIIPHLPEEVKAPGCPTILFVLVGIRSFADRTLEALDVAKRCRGKIQGILYLTLSWSVNLEDRLKSVAEIFRDYGVSDVCRREPIASSPITYY
jgi:hypothetical protein